jgi:phage-related protein
MQPTIAINGVDLGAMGFKVRSPNGIWNTPVASSEGIQVPGRAGQLVPQASMVTLASRTIDIVGTLVGTSRADYLTKLDALKAFLAAPLTVVLAEQPTRQYTARCLSVTVTESGPVFIQRKQQVSISLFCDDPYAYDTALQTVGFTTATAIPMGTAPTGGVITITGAAAFTLTYKNSAGATLVTMVFAGVTSPITIDLDTFIVTDGSGNALGKLTSGEFPRLSPLDGVFGTSTWPTLQVSAGTGSISYRRAYQ